MKNILLIAIFISFLGCDAPIKQEFGDEKFNKVMQLPIGLKVTHTPRSVKAMEGGRSGYNFTWLHTTTLESSEKVKVIEFGAFAKQGNRWFFANYLDRPFTNDEFAEWYECPNGILQPNKKYSDKRNWSGGDELNEGEALWYFIGETTTGELLRGTAKLVTKAEMID